MPRKLLLHELRPTGVMVEVPGHQRDIQGAGLPDGLPVVHALQHREEPPVLLDPPGQGVQVPRPAMGAQGPPARLSGPSRLHGGGHVGLGALEHRGDGLSGHVLAQSACRSCKTASMR